MIRVPAITMADFMSSNDSGTLAFDPVGEVDGAGVPVGIGARDRAIACKPRSEFADVVDGELPRIRLVVFLRWQHAIGRRADAERQRNQNCFHVIYLEKAAGMK